MSKNKIVWFALLTMLLWGSLFPMVKLGFSTYGVDSTADILLFAGIRFVICGCAICAFTAIKDKDSYRPVKQIGALFYVCFSFLFIKDDTPTVKKIVAGMMGFLGIIALNISSKGFSFSIGDFLILCASFCTVFSNVISKKGL